MPICFGVNKMNGMDVCFRRAMLLPGRIS